MSVQQQIVKISSVYVRTYVCVPHREEDTDLEELMGKVMSVSERVAAVVVGLRAGGPGGHKEVATPTGTSFDTYMQVMKPLQFGTLCYVVINYSQKIPPGPNGHFPYIVFSKMANHNIKQDAFKYAMYMYMWQ